MDNPISTTVSAARSAFNFRLVVQILFVFILINLLLDLLVNVGGVTGQKLAAFIRAPFSAFKAITGN